MTRNDIIEKGENIMMNTNLCSSCTYTQDCMYQKDSDRPVWQCEEYEGDENPSEKIRGKNTRSSPPKQADIKEYSAQYKGLCQTCEYRETCTYPKPEGGVWHCEEYL